MSAARARLADGRLHLQHGPIDVIAQAWGTPDEVDAAYDQAWARFQGILEELVAELPSLREPIGPRYPLFAGSTARRMAEATWPHRDVFVTPMAAVAGAVADELMAALLAGRQLVKACVNDGGDIALHLSAGATLFVGVVNDVSNPSLDARTEVSFSDPVRGIATSGWRGRSQSLGIADAVTILAVDAATADAAATLVANAVDIDHPAIERRPARTIKEDTDLGDLPVTVSVGPLPASARARALQNGVALARRLRDRGLLHAAYLSLQGEAAVLGPAACNELPLHRKLGRPEFLTLGRPV